MSGHSHEHFVHHGRRRDSQSGSTALSDPRLEFGREAIDAADRPSDPNSGSVGEAPLQRWHAGLGLA